MIMMIRITVRWIIIHNSLNWNLIPRKERKYNDERDNYKNELSFIAIEYIGNLISRKEKTLEKGWF